MFEVKHDNKIKGKDYFVYKIITFPIRADIVDVYSKLENCIVVLGDLVVICEKAWYLCKRISCNKKSVVLVSKCYLVRLCKIEL